MSSKRTSRVSWKKEVAALAAGLLLGSAWEAAHAGVRPAATPSVAPAPHP